MVYRLADMSCSVCRVIVRTFCISCVIFISYESLLFALHKNRFRASDIKSLIRTPRYISMSLAEKSAQLPLKIAVAGGGVGGVMLAYALQKKGFDVTVFEKASKFSRFGGPIQLASNALSCVNDLSPELFEQIMGRYVCGSGFFTSYNYSVEQNLYQPCYRFTFTGTRKCGIKDGIRNNWYSVFEAIKNLAEWNTLPYTGVIDRPDLQEILLNNMKEGTILNSKGISAFVEHAGTYATYTYMRKQFKQFNPAIQTEL